MKLAAVLGFVGFVHFVSFVQTPPGITRVALLENSTVMMARLTMAPGARETIHTHPFSAVVVQLGPGEVEMRIGTKPETARQQRGHVEYIAAEIPHAAANVGSAAFDVLTIAIKPDRTRGGTQPPLDPPGISRSPVLDNADARVTHVTFAPGSREPMHTHPFDLVVVQLTPARMEVIVGEEKSVKSYATGEYTFIPRNAPHAFASADSNRVEVLSVGVK